MTRNEGNLDRALRFIVGFGLVLPTLAGVIGPWGWIGVVPLVTATIGWCPLYQVLGVDTCGLKKG